AAGAESKTGAPVETDAPVKEKSQWVLVPESRHAIRRAEARRAVITDLRRAQVAATAAAVAARRDVEERGSGVVRVVAVVHCGAVDAVHARDQRGRDARAAELEPAGASARLRSVHGDARARVRDRGDVADRTLRTSRIQLPDGLGVDSAAAAA